MRLLLLLLEGREALAHVSLTCARGELVGIMGPNGSGKSTLSYAVAGRENYDVTAGAVTLGGEGILGLDPNARAAKGLFLSFQHPMEIPGVATMNFIRTALNAQKKARGEAEISSADFLKLIRAKSKIVGLTDEKLKRPFNVGFSGGDSKDDLLLITGLIEAGRVRPVIDRTYPLEKIADAHRYVDSGRKRGGVVVLVNAAA